MNEYATHFQQERNPAGWINMGLGKFSPLKPNKSNMAGYHAVYFSPPPAGENIKQLKSVIEERDKAIVLYIEEINRLKSTPVREVGDEEIISKALEYLGEINYKPHYVAYFTKKNDIDMGDSDFCENCIDEQVQITQNENPSAVITKENHDPDFGGGLHEPTECEGCGTLPCICKKSPGWRVRDIDYESKEHHGAYADDDIDVVPNRKEASHDL